MMGKNEHGGGILYEYYESLISVELRNIIFQTLKSFAYGYSIKTLIALLFNIKNIKKDPTVFLKLFFQIDQIDSGMFLASYCFLMKTMTMLSKKYGKNPAVSSFLSGFSAGLLSMQFIKKENRAVFALYTLARSFDMIFQSMMKKTELKVFKSFYIFVFALLQMQVYFYSMEPVAVPKSIFKFYSQVSCQSEADKNLHHILISKQNIWNAAKGIEPMDSYQILSQKK